MHPITDAPEDACNVVRTPHSAQVRSAHLGGLVDLVDGVLVGEPDLAAAAHVDGREVLVHVVAGLFAHHSAARLSKVLRTGSMPWVTGLFGASFT